MDYSGFLGVIMEFHCQLWVLMGEDVFYGGLYIFMGQHLFLIAIMGF